MSGFKDLGNEMITISVLQLTKIFLTQLILQKNCGNKQTAPCSADLNMVRLADEDGLKMISSASGLH